ncbi:MAG: hypothetical protein WDO24_26860 [Pseudomonadota bacterium]
MPVDRLAPLPADAPLDDPADRVAAAPPSVADDLIAAGAAPALEEAPRVRRVAAQADRLVPNAISGAIPGAIKVAALTDETAWSALARSWSSEPPRPEPAADGTAVAGGAARALAARAELAGDHRRAQDAVRAPAAAAGHAGQ